MSDRARRAEEIQAAYEDKDPTARTIRLIKAQALRDAVALFKERFEGKARVLQPGYLQAEYELVIMAQELEK